MPRFIAFHPALFLFLFGTQTSQQWKLFSESRYSVAMILFVSITSEGAPPSLAGANLIAARGEDRAERGHAAFGFLTGDFPFAGVFALTSAP